jgi:hypothetical protein
LTISAYSLAVLNVGFAARLLISFALLLSQAGLFALLCLAADAIGFFLCFAAFRFDSGLFSASAFCSAAMRSRSACSACAFHTLRAAPLLHVHAVRCSTSRAAPPLPVA